MSVPSSSFSLNHPFRVPDRRFRRAKDLVTSNRPTSRRHDDADTIELGHFLRAEHRSQDDKSRALLERRWPALCIAALIAASDVPRRWELDARLLGGQSDENVAVACGMTPEAVRCYETVHFNVRDRL